MDESDRQFWLKKALENLKAIRGQSPNEKETQRLLIEPLLAWAGYEVWEWKPDELREDYAVKGIKGDEYPDYALIHKGQTYILLEAKAFGEHLDKYLEKLLAYCKLAEIRFGLITNGERWILLDRFWEGDSPSEKRVFDLKIEDRIDDKRGYDVLLLLHPSQEPLLEKATKTIKNIFKGEKDENLRKKFIRVALGDVLEKVRIPAGLEEPLVLPGHEKGRGAATEEWGEWPEDLSILTSKKPPEYVLIDGVKFETRSWASIVVNVAEWLAKRGEIKEPIKSRTLFIINDRRKQETRIRNPEYFMKPLTNAKGFYVWTFGSAVSCLERSFGLLEHFGYKPCRDYLKPPKGWKP